jgi:hypothetical protein
MNHAIRWSGFLLSGAVAGYFSGGLALKVIEIFGLFWDAPPGRRWQKWEDVWIWLSASIPAYFPFQKLGIEDFPYGYFGIPYGFILLGWLAGAVIGGIGLWACWPWRKWVNAEKQSDG